jgi:hypothetical protein
MPQGVSCDKPFAGNNVVIHKQHDLASGSLGRGGSRRVRSGMGLLEDHNPTVLRA